MGFKWSLFFPPPPTLTEANLPRQDGKVFIITGGTSGIGMELCDILYHAGATVYLAGRSESKAQAAIAHITARADGQPGALHFMQVSLDDLSTIKPAVDKFLAAESRLDALVNNAGISNPPSGSVGAQGHDLTMVTNCLAPYLMTQLLVPVLTRTAKLAAAPGDVRVVWTSSMVTDLDFPKGGYNFDMMTTTGPPRKLYRNSKTANWFLATELANQIGSDGVLSLTQNPGNMNTGILRHVPFFVRAILWPFFHKPRMGAYTELYAAVSPDLTIDDGGGYVLPWGRIHPQPRQDIVKECQSKEDGGTGLAAAFVEYCDQQTREYR